MIEYIRRKSNSLIFKIFLWLVIFSFAIVGFTGAFNIVGNTALSVDGKSYSISSLYGDAVDYMTRNDITLSSDEEIYQLTLALANQRAIEMSLDSEMKRQGFTASDDLVKQSIIRDFTGANGFDKGAYERYLKNIGISEPELLNTRRMQVAQQQFQMSVAYALKAPDYYEKLLEPQFQNLARLADVKYKLISAKDVQNLPAPTNEAIEVYYNDNKESFRAPEYREVKVFEYSADDFKKANPEGNFVSSFNQLMDSIDDDLSAGFSVEQLQEKHGGSINVYILDNQQMDKQGKKVDIPAQMLTPIFSDNAISPVIIGSDDTGIATGLYSFEVKEVIASRILPLDDVKAEIVEQLTKANQQQALTALVEKISTQEESFDEIAKNLSAPLTVKTGIDKVNLASEINPFMNNAMLDALYLGQMGEKHVLDLQGNWYIFEVTAFNEGLEDSLAAIKQQRMDGLNDAYAQSTYLAFMEDISKSHKVKIKAGNIRSTIVPRLRTQK